MLTSQVTELLNYRVCHFCLQPTRKEQAAALIDLVLRRDNRAFISFYNSLVKETYDDLAKLLYADLPDVSFDGQKSSSDSSISYGEE